jgi:hypothetical protein
MNHLYKLQNKVNELNDRVVKIFSFINTQKSMEKNMEQLQIFIDKKMENLQNSMSTIILHTLDEIFPKVDIKMQGKHENVKDIRTDS